jgi:hypothetical protein
MAFRLPMRRHRGRLFVVILLLGSILTGCGGPGRVALILDSSGSMAERGTTGMGFSEIKSIALSSLRVIPRANEIGLRVFDMNGSRLVSEYSRDLAPLERRLKTIQPSGSTHIGASLKDAAQDLAQFRRGPIKLFLVTDGLGDGSDVQAAIDARERILAGRDDFNCTFIVFSSNPAILDHSSTKRAADEMGCTFATPGQLSSGSLMSSLLSTFSMSFAWVWLLVSAALYLIMVALTSHMVFQTNIAKQGTPRAAMTWAGVFLFSMFALVVAIHSAGIFLQIGMRSISVLTAVALLATFASIILRKRKSNDETFKDPFG